MIQPNPYTTSRATRASCAPKKKSVSAFQLPSSQLRIFFPQARLFDDETQWQIQPCSRASETRIAIKRSNQPCTRFDRTRTGSEKNDALCHRDNDRLTLPTYGLLDHQIMSPRSRPNKAMKRYGKKSNATKPFDLRTSSECTVLLHALQL